MEYCVAKVTRKKKKKKQKQKENFKNVDFFRIVTMQ
jgi:hypothetical protein